MQDLTTFLANHPLLSLACAIVLVLVMFVELIRARRGVYNISPQELAQLINHENAVTIDIRSQEEYLSGHIINSLNISAEAITKNPKLLEKYKIKPIIFIDKTGRESQKLAAFMMKNSYNVYSLVGGISTWVNEQLPLVKE